MDREAQATDAPMFWTRVTLTLSLGSRADPRTSTVGSPGSRERLIEYGQQVALSQGGFEHPKDVPHTRKIDAVFLHAQEHDHVRDVLATCRSRYVALMADSAVASVIVFRNRGKIAGASLLHPHAQLIALSAIAPLVQARQAAMLSYYQKEKRCVLCDIIAYERDNGSRVVNEDRAFLTIVPLRHMLLARCGFCQSIIRRISAICRITRSNCLRSRFATLSRV